MSAIDDVPPGSVVSADFGSGDGTGIVGGVGSDATSPPGAAGIGWSAGTFGKNGVSVTLILGEAGEVGIGATGVCVIVTSFGGIKSFGIETTGSGAGAGGGGGGGGGGGTGFGAGGGIIGAGVTTTGGATLIGTGAGVGFFAGVDFLSRRTTTSASQHSTNPTSHTA